MTIIGGPPDGFEIDSKTRAWIKKTNPTKKVQKLEKEVKELRKMLGRLLEEKENV